MNVHFALSFNTIILILAGIACYWAMYRLYLLVSRRCPRCGSLLVKREGVMSFPSGEKITFRNAEGRFRFFIRIGVKKLLFIRCLVCKLILLEKIDRGRVDVIHAMTHSARNSRFHGRRSGLFDPDLIREANRWYRALYLDKDEVIDPELTDPPPFSVHTVWRDCRFGFDLFRKKAIQIVRDKVV